MEEELYNFWIHEVDKDISGWDFPSIRDRMVTSPLEWSYTSEVFYPLRRVERLLDLETGGGEYLSSLQPLPSRTVATESYQDNLSVAKNNLEPLGAEVIDTSDTTTIPVEDNSFDLVINRHGQIDAREIYRVLDDDGYFITQQVGSADQKQLNQLLLKDDTKEETWNIDIAVQQLEEAGFEVIKALESRPLTRFYDIGALVFYLRKVSWQVNDFSVEKYDKQLRSIHAIINQKGSIESLAHRFFISAVKT